MATAPRFTVVRGGRVLDPRTRRAAPAALLIEGDTIREIGPPGLAAPAEAAVIDAADRAIIPGLVNGHVHGHGTLAKGLVDDRWPLELFLNALPGLSGNRVLEDKYLNGLIAAVELIRKGCTCCYDLFFEFPKPSREGLAALGQAYADAGLRAVIAPMVADRTLYQAYPGLLEAMPEALREEALRLQLAPCEASADAAAEAFRDWPFDRDKIRPAIAPTIPLHCSDDFLRRCRDLARDYDLPLQTHLAETKAQALLGLRKYGRSLTAHLDGLEMLEKEELAIVAHIGRPKATLQRNLRHTLQFRHCALYINRCLRQAFRCGFFSVCMRFKVPKNCTLCRSLAFHFVWGRYGQVLGPVLHCQNLR